MILPFLWAQKLSTTVSQVTAHIPKTSLVAFIRKSMF